MLPAVSSDCGHAANMPAAVDERPLITQAGLEWPVARHEMRALGAIARRMAEDLDRAIAEAGDFEAVCEETLLALGWTAEQVRRFGPDAARRMAFAARARAEENACGNDPAPRRAASEEAA